MNQSNQTSTSDKTYYTVDDIMQILGIGQSKAYEIIRNLRQELVKKGYAEYPAGRIPKRYFNERFYI